MSNHHTDTDSDKFYFVVLNRELLHCVTCRTLFFHDLYVSRLLHCVSSFKIVSLLGPYCLNYPNCVSLKFYNKIYTNSYTIFCICHVSLFTFCLLYFEHFYFLCYFINITCSNRLVCENFFPTKHQSLRVLKRDGMGL